MPRKTILGMLVVVVVALGLALAVKAALDNVFALQGDATVPGTIDVILKGIGIMAAAIGLGAAGLLFAGWLFTAKFPWMHPPLTHLPGAPEGIIPSGATRQRRAWAVLAGLLFLVLDVAALLLGLQVTRANLRVWQSSPGVGIALTTAAGEALMVVLLVGLGTIQVVWLRWLRSGCSRRRQ
jgi:hypothetical protein